MKFPPPLTTFRPLLSQQNISSTEWKRTPIHQIKPTMNYNKLNTLLQGRNFNQRKIANNTYAIRHADSIAIVLHSTEILTFTPDGRVRYNNGGWATSTTKSRMNDFGPARIHQQDFTWYITYAGQTEEYFNGITFTTN